MTPAAHGSVALNADGSFTYTPNTGFYGTDSFSYQISAGTHVSNTATVTLQVAAPNTINLVAGMDFSKEQLLSTDPTGNRQYLPPSIGLHRCRPLKSIC